MSLINDFGSLYLASRLERLSEMLKKDAILVFKNELKGIKYKWYPVIYTLHKTGSLGVVELANELSYAHPTIIDTLREMQAENIVKSAPGKQDNRKRILSLTAKGKRLFQQILPLTKAFETAVNDLIDNNNNLLLAIEEVETRLEDESFFKKVNKILNHKNSKLKTI